MSLPVILTPEAKADVAQARSYIKSERPGAEEKFFVRLEDVLLGISGMPEMHRVISKNVRVALVRKFKYLVYYRVHEDSVEVIAVLHGSRDESAWKRRAK